jgi:mycothiol synthase
MTTLTAFQARPYAGDADVPAITALLNLCDAVDDLDDSYTEDDLRREFESPELDAAKDLHLWEDADGRLVGFGQIWIPKESEKVDGGLYLRVHPDARGQHLEEEILAWGEARAREAAAEQGKPAQIRCWLREGNYVGAILEGQGLQIVRYFYKMARPLDEPLPEPQLPEGFRMITATDAGDSHLERWVDMFNGSFIDHWNHHPLSVENHQHWLASPKYQADRDLVAVAPDGTYAAFCFCWNDPDNNARKNRKEGWIDILGTRRGYRKIGLGTAMLLAGMHLLKHEGMDTAVLGVDAENPSGALRLYESVGFRSVRTSVTYSKDLA